MLNQLDLQWASVIKPGALRAGMRYLAQRKWSEASAEDAYNFINECNVNSDFAVRLSRSLLVGKGIDVFEARSDFNGGFDPNYVPAQWICLLVLASTKVVVDETLACQESVYSSSRSVAIKYVTRHVCRALTHLQVSEFKIGSLPRQAAELFGSQFSPDNNIAVQAFCESFRRCISIHMDPLTEISLEVVVSLFVLRLAAIAKEASKISGLHASCFVWDSYFVMLHDGTVGYEWLRNAVVVDFA